jgi:hypothetical protein
MVGLHVKPLTDPLTCSSTILQRVEQRGGGGGAWRNRPFFPLLPFLLRCFAVPQRFCSYITDVTKQGNTHTHTHFFSLLKKK